MNPELLTKMYDDIKKDSIVPPVQNKSMRVGVGGLDGAPLALAWRNKAAKCAEQLKDDCRKHIIIDVYCKILPLDKEWIDNHHGKVCHDVDCMLGNKDMTATQYLTSAFESTNAPFVEYLLRSTNMIGRTYMEEQEEILKDAQEKDINVPDPKEPTTDDEDIENSLVDIKQDIEYEDFVDQLKKKTVDKIVNDISKIIEDKKDENDMTFETESVVAVSMDYMQKYNWGTEITESINDEMIGMAIREATLREFDLVFNQPVSFNECATRIRNGKGNVVTNECLESIRDNK